MSDPLMFLALGALAVVLILQVLIFVRRAAPGSDARHSVEIRSAIEQMGQSFREQLQQQRVDLVELRGSTEAVGARVTDLLPAQGQLIGALSQHVTTVMSGTEARVGEMKLATEERLTRLTESIDGRLQSFGAASSTSSKELREELAASIATLSSSLGQNISQTSSMQKDQLEIFARSLNTLVERNDQFRATVEEKLALFRAEMVTSHEKLGSDAQANRDRQRDEMQASLKAFGDLMARELGESRTAQTALLQASEQRIAGLAESNEKRLDVLRSTVDGKLEKSRQEMQATHTRLGEEASQNRVKQRDEIRDSLKQFGDSMTLNLSEMREAQAKSIGGFGDRIAAMSDANEKRFEILRGAIDSRLNEIRESNEKKLEEMRATVDEKLQGTLEKRLGESFAQVSDRLEQVHKGLGEMQSLATGVGDLKRVLTNVKTRGGWGEVQLGALLEQLLAPEQFEKNVVTREGTREAVEFAIKLPARGDQDGITYLPIDAKFPVEDYQRLMDAHEKADVEGIETAGKALEISIRTCAKTISDKYLNPPVTTDFGIMFLPTEGLYAEVARRPALIEQMQRLRVVIAGPTNLAVILNSLQMGFRSLAIQKRSSEVWSLLGVVKSEFGKFGESLDAVKKKLQEAQNKIELTGQRSRAIERKLRDVQTLPEKEAGEMLMIRASDDDSEDVVPVVLDLDVFDDEELVGEQSGSL
jgi:DNA recombination protein RmuC